MISGVTTVFVNTNTNMVEHTVEVVVAYEVHFDGHYSVCQTMSDAIEEAKDRLRHYDSVEVFKTTTKTIEKSRRISPAVVQRMLKKVGCHE